MQLPDWSRRRWTLLAAAVYAIAVLAIGLALAPLSRLLLFLVAGLVAFVAAPAIVLRGWRRVAGGFAGAIVFLVLFLAGIRLRYGGGADYPDLRTPPTAPANALGVAVTVDYPPGNVAVAPDGRTFFCYHPFAKAERFAPATVFELVAGVPRPYPDAAFQARYQGVFGMTVDRLQRLWFTEPAGLDHDTTRLLVFDLRTNTLVYEHEFPSGQARFAQDLRVSPDGKTVYLADTGAFEFLDASLIVLDVASHTHRRVLVDHATTRPQRWLMRTKLGPQQLAYGLISFVVGVDGLELSADGSWLYYGAMSHDHLYKVPTAALRDAALDDDAVAAQIVEVGRKPLSDGITVDRDGSVVITDVEHGGLSRLTAGGTLTTIVSSPDVIWADGVVLAPDGSFLFTDSAIPAYVDQLARPPSADALVAGRPYKIYRVAPATR